MYLLRSRRRGRERQGGGGQEEAHDAEVREEDEVEDSDE